MRLLLPCFHLAAITYLDTSALDARHATFDAQPSTRPTPESQAAFTVLELLGVIFILGFLLTMVFPALNRMHAAMDRRRAGAETRMLAEAVLHYRRIYDTWPPVDEHAVRLGMKMPDRDFAFGEPLNGDPDAPVNIYDQALLISALSTTNRFANPRRVRFIELPENRVDAQGRFLDPWGDVYIVALDGNNNGWVELDIANERIQRQEPAAVFSLGEPRGDRKPIRSWELP